MDPGLMPSDHPEPAVSPEPSSTRPNPFDDSDASSRKRRRTSGSGSPTVSIETVQPAAHLAANSDASNSADTVPDNTMKLDKDSEPPRNRDQDPASRTPLEEPPASSRVTLNLRNAPYSDSMPSLADPPLSTFPENDVPIPEADTIKKSVEEPELDMAQSLDVDLETSQRSSSASASPQIEVITVQDDDDTIDDDMSFDPFNVEVAIVGEDVAFTDPTTQFPYHDPEDTLPETVHRLTQYISTQSPIESAVLDQVQVWIELYLKFAKHAGPRSVLDSCRVHRNFWLSLPDVFLAMTNRKPSLLKSSALRSTVVDLYSAFTELTARFVAIDSYILHEWLSNMSRSDSRGPLLFSTGYLQQLHALTRRHDLPSDDESTEAPASSWARSDQVSYFVGQLQATPKGSIESLGKLATLLIEVIPTLPKLSDSLAPVIQVLTNCLRESYRILRLRQQGVPRAKQRLKLGHELWSTISSFLNTTVEKHVTSLSSDGASCEIQALAEMLHLCLHGDHEDAVIVLREHRQTYPGLSPRYTPEAVAWEWKVDIMGKLIRSSQMQLRVMAVTTLCSDLVALWRRLCDAGEDHNIAFLNHLGDYLLRINLIDYILGPNCHPEIIMESANIIGFLVVTKMYRAEHTDRLWQGITAGQDPRVADALTRMITTIANLFDYPGLLCLCEKFQTLPIEAFNPAVRMLWDNMLRELVARCQMEQTTLSFLPYDLCLRLLRESSVCASGSQVAYPEMQHAAMQKFKDLLSHGPDPQGRRELYLSCIKDVAAKSPTTLGSLWCLSMAIRPAILVELRVLTEQHDLVRLIVEELENAIQAGQTAGVPAVLSGGTNQPRRDFVTNIIQHQPEAINNDLGKRLWDILVGPQSPCADDRKSGWQIIMSIVTRTTSENPFLRTCFSQYLPSLPSSCFCEGMLDFVKEQVLWLVNESVDCALDEEAFVAKSSIEHLWRIILAADDTMIVEPAIRTLAIDVYLESCTITTYPFNRARQVHVSLVNRCLNQLKDAARRIKASVDGTSSGEDEPMVIVATDEEIQEQERMFIRSLQLLCFFMEAHYSKPYFSAPDLRSLMSQEPHQVEGDLAQLKYQSFDGAQQTEVKPLRIGRLNTAASLLASLSRETGFENYRVFYRGHPFLPTEDEICKSLEDLHVHEGLILVKREEGSASPSVRVKPGSSPLEIEILSHFQELWEYLSMDDTIAKEIYNLLVKLPADGHIIELFESETTSYKDVFLSGQPFKSLYAIHALVEYTETARQAASDSNHGIRYRGFSHTSYEEALRKSQCLVVQAISDRELLERTNPQMQVQLMGSLMQTFVKLLEDARPPTILGHADGAAFPSADRLVAILSNAASSTEEAAVSLISSTMTTILRLGLQDARFWEDVASNPEFFELVPKLALFDSRKTVRELVLELIEDVVDGEDQPPSSMLTSPSEANTPPPHALTRFFWSIVSNLLAEVVKLPRQCHELFTIFQFLLLRVSKTSATDVDFHKLAGQTSELLLSHISTEEIDQIEPLDPVARGLVSLLHLCMQIDDTLPNSILLPDDLGQLLFWRHLFPQSRAQPDQPVPKILLNTDTRAKLCEVVFRLVRQDREKFGSLLKSLNSLVPYYSDENDDPYVYELPCQFERPKAIRSPCGYVGLRNLSNTCYLNSLLTQLFMNTQFRRFIMKSSIRDPLESQQLLFLTQKLFGYMQESYHRFVDPANVIGAIKTYEDSLIDIHSQMDVDEFYNLLFDRWEAQLLTGDEKKRLRSFYGGQLVQQVKSKECDHISERLEPFSAIQCDIKGKSTLQESLQAYVDGEIMEGDNKYKCSSCDRHVDAVKRACLKDIPDHLIFHLKRFDFNLRTLQRSKINDYFSFPPTIDMRPYTIEHLSDSMSGKGEDTFELVGILVHSGTAESGHYYSYIRERPSSACRPNWVEFNDDIVTPWDPSLMENSTFGGPDQRSIYDNNGIIYDKTYSAYMLFYQRASSVRSEQQFMSTQDIAAPLRVETDPQLREHILNENTLIVRRHCLFDPSHAVFVQNCFTQARHLDEGQPQSVGHSRNGDGNVDRQQSHDLKGLAMEMTMSHLDQVVTRTKDMPQFGHFSEMIKSAVLGCHKCAFAYYDYFNLRHSAFRALLQRNPDTAVRTFTGQTLVSALERISVKSPQLYYSANSVRHNSNEQMDETFGDDLPAPEPSVLEGAILLLNHLWRFFQIHIRSWDEYFSTILEFAKLGEREVVHLLANDYLLKLLRIIAADAIMDLPSNYARMLHNVLRRVNSRPPSYVAILAVIDHLLQQLEPVLGATCIVERPLERLDHAGVPFPWTSEEVQFIHNHPERQLSSFFAEKLLGIDQAQDITHSIIGRLVATGGQMDFRIFNTLRKNVQGDTTTQPMDPFLRAASQYLESTQSLDHARNLIRHMSTQAKNLQNAEGTAFLEFFGAALNLRRPDAEMVKAIHDCGLGTIPDWAPYLLVYADNSVRCDTEQLMEDELFQSVLEDSGEDTLSLERRDAAEDVIQKLGMGCLVYLRDTHIKRRAQIGQEAASTILRVIGKCATCSKSSLETDDVADAEFRALQSEVIGPLRRLIVEEIDDDGSDWDGSCISSDPLDAHAEMGIQTVNDLDDTNLI